MKFAGRLLRDESGATAVEYGVIIGGIAALVVVVLFALGTKVNKLYNNALWP